MTPAQATCFHEADPEVALSIRAGAEAIGTLMLVFAASGAGISASRLLDGTPGAIPIVIAAVLSAALVSLIVAIGSVSGGHFNPLITIMQWMAGERPLKCMLAYVTAQMGGAAAGGVLATELWQIPASLAGGLSWPGAASEFVASAGLMLIVFGCARSGRTATGPFAVGVWLFAAVLATPTASYANPAVVVGALVTSGPLALGIVNLIPYTLAEFAGAMVALAVIAALFPAIGSQR